MNQNLRARSGGAGRPSVSIVTASYNRRDLLRQTIESVRRQSFADYEHIVIDGASSDGTVEMLERLEGTYPLRWISEPDEGMYQAINRGLSMAQGEVLAYLNSDDLYFPWTLDVVSEYFDSHPSVDLVFGDAVLVDDGTGWQTPALNPPFDLDHIRRSGFLIQPAVFWRRSVLETEGGFDESLRYLADCDYWMRVGEHHRFGKVNEFVAVERNHDQTLRESQASGIQAELELTRSRYVRVTGRQHQRRVRRHDVANRIWSRLYRLAFLAQSLVPTRLRRGPWRHYLAAAGDDVSRVDLALTQIPALGLGRGRILHPNRRWLRPGSLSD